MAVSTITPKALAAQLGTNPKALRRFMRSLADAAQRTGADPKVARVGQGNRYDLSAGDARFISDAWRKAHGMPKAPARKAPAARKAKAPKAAPAAPAAASEAPVSASPAADAPAADA